MLCTPEVDKREDAEDAYHEQLQQQHQQKQQGLVDVALMEPSAADPAVESSWHEMVLTAVGDWTEFYGGGKKDIIFKIPCILNH